MAKKSLGRGLDELLADNSIENKESNGVTTLKISDVEPNRGQARTIFDENALMELSDSIGRHGVLQPITVRRKPNGFYEIIAGERRWRASKMAGLSDIPALIIEADDMLASELSLIENLQRENLNPAEEARGYRDLIERFGFTQEEAAERVGKSRASVANILRILKLPEDVLKLVEDGSLSYGHARAIIPLTQVYEDDTVLEQAKSIISNGLSVRQTEQLVKKLLMPEKTVEPVSDDTVSKAYYKKIERDICTVLGRKTTIQRSADGKGKISISFSDAEDLEILIKSLCGNDFFNNEE